MSDVDDLIEFLRAQIEADKAAATKATTGAWVPMYRDVHAVDGDGRTSHLVTAEIGADAEHIARHDPRDVIADCEAKLTAIRRCEEAMADPPTPEDGQAAHDVHTFLELLAKLVLQDLAQGYRHRDGWREGWSG